jgi:hypothetical protein
MYGTPQELQDAADASASTRAAFMQKYSDAPQQPADSSVIPTAQAAEPDKIEYNDPDLAEAAKESAAVRASFMQKYPSQAARTPKEEHDASDKQSMLGSLALGGHVGLYELVARAVQGGAKLGEITGYMPKGTAAEFTRQFNEKYLKDPRYIAAMKQHPIAARTGEIAGAVTPLLPAMYLAPAAARAIGMEGLGAGATGRVIGGAAMGLAQYDPTGHQTLRQMGTGALANLLLPPMIGKAVGSLAGATKTLTPEVVAAAKKYGVKLSPYPKLEKALATIPYSGVGKIISARGKKVAQAAKEIADKIISEAPGGKQQITENGVETGYASHFTDALKRRYYASKKTVQQLKSYLMKRTDEHTAKTGDLVDPISMKKAAFEASLQQQSLPPKFQNTSLVKDLNLHSGAQPMTFRAADALKKQLDDKISKMGTPVTGVEKNTRRLYTSMRSGLKDDIDAFAKAAPKDIQQIHSTADKHYEEAVAPFDKPPYSKLLTGDMNSGQFISKFIKPVKEVAGGEQPEDINKLLSLMPKSNSKSRYAMRAAIMSRALEKADLPGSGINGKKFADEITNLSKASGGVFNKAQKDVFKGYQILTHHLEKYQPKVTDIEKLQKTSWPMRTLHMGGLGMAFFHPYIMSALYGSGLAVSKLFTTKAGQSLLRGVANTAAKAGSSRLNPYVTRGLKMILTKEMVRRMRG